MRKTLLAFVTILLLGSKAFGQIGDYGLTTSSSGYANLTSSTVVSSTIIPWDSTANFSIPIGFNFIVDGIVTDHVYLHRVNSFCVDTFTHPILWGFQLLNAALIDRGSGSPASPISYNVSGTLGSQIFKLEINKAGFINELINHSTLNDYTNIQLWLYEGSNVVEIHYGPSHITNPGEYFVYSGGNPIIGYCKRKNYTGDGTMYTVNGPASSINNLHLDDSTVFSSFAITYLSQGILGFPANGTVLKFTPEKAGVKNVNVSQAHVYPTMCKTEIMIDYNNAEQTTFEVISVRGIPTTMQGYLQNGTTHIDLSKIAAGTYLLRLQNSSGKFVQKFTKL